MSKRCAVIFDRSDFKDISGCIKPYGHIGAHVCETKDGKLMEWEDDYECTCGCWESEDFNDVCRVYSDVTKTFKP